MTRVLSLHPAATEIVAALGAGSSLVGISHACDYPPSITGLPRVTRSAVDVQAPSHAIDAQVRARLEASRPVVEVDADAVRELAPDLVLTQALCDVCAVGDGAPDLPDILAPGARILALTGTTLAGVEDDIRSVAQALDVAAEADELVAGLRYRLARLRQQETGPRPRVVCVEWLEPLYLAGHWVPEQVEAAGGVDVAARPGEKSRRRSWAEVVAMRPDVVVMMLCGFDAPRARQEWAAFARAHPGVIALLGETPVRFLDGNTWTSRPGPRLVDGAVELRRVLGR